MSTKLAYYLISFSILYYQKHFFSNNHFLKLLFDFFLPVFFKQSITNLTDLYFMLVYKVIFRENFVLAIAVGLIWTVWSYYHIPQPSLKESGEFLLTRQCVNFCATTVVTNTERLQSRSALLSFTCYGFLKIHLFLHRTVRLLTDLESSSGRNTSGMLTIVNNKTSFYAICC